MTDLTVVGATGRTGRHVLAEALRRGHRVTAFTRRPESLNGTTGLAGVVSGDGRDPDALRPAVARAGAVIAIVGSSTRKGPHPIAAVARALTATMTEVGVRRLVITSAYPIVARKPRLPIALLRLVFAEAYADAAAMERIVSGCDLDWIIVRLNRLTDKAPGAALRVSQGQFDRPTALSRADAARALLDIVEDAGTAKTALNVAGPG